ncbi:MAG: aldehyde ferredoxin oxidoreductase family protein [Promethearchaeota archaeon]|jgi:aldehyde:ferredoxin oxidoreductase
MSEKLIGYNGKIAYVDLTNKKWETKDLVSNIAKEYLGGTGLSAKLTYDLLSENDYKTLKNDPFNEINPLIFATGPVTGTIRPSSGRYTVTGISPLTKIWGESSSGGFFCISLRNSGFDAIVITGKSETPTYLYIHDKTIEFKDASNYWGKDTYETQELIKSELNNERVRVVTVGQGAENLVKYAAMINDEGRAIGRCGLGALMASKNVKALAVLGSGRVEISDSNLGKDLIKQAEDALKGDATASLGSFLFTLYGTNGYLDIGMVLGDTPANYFTETEFLAEKLTGKTLREEYPVLDYGCAGCTIKCGKRTIVDDNGKEILVDGPEYESVAAFGPLCGVYESKEVILAHHLSNVYGVDTISCGVSIAFLIYLVENKLGIDQIKQHLKGTNLEDIRWGNGALILDLIEKISKRDGIGNLLADGTRIMAEKLGIDPELAAHVKGLEIPMHDPRAFAGQALSYITCCVGANHEKCDWFNTELGSPTFPDLKIQAGDRTSIKRRENGVIALQDIRAIDDSAVNCNFPKPTLEHIVGHINAATGFGYDANSLLFVGERINNLKRVISCNLGITRADDRLPNHVLKVLKSGKTTDVKMELDKNLEKYYKFRGWDWETGRPTEEKLKELKIIK